MYSLGGYGFMQFKLKNFLTILIIHAQKYSRNISSSLDEKIIYDNFEIVQGEDTILYRARKITIKLSENLVLHDRSKHNPHKNPSHHSVC